MLWFLCALYTFPSSYLFCYKFTDVSGSRTRARSICLWARDICELARSTISANYAAARSVYVRLYVFMCVCVSLYAACVAARTACHLRPRTCACRVNCVASLSHEDRSERNNAKRMSTYQSEVINLYFKKNCSSQIYFNSKFTILLALDFFLLYALMLLSFILITHKYVFEQQYCKIYIIKLFILVLSRFVREYLLCI